MDKDYLTKKDWPLFTSAARINVAKVLYNEKKSDDIATFDLFVRELPNNRNYLVFAGLEHAIEYIQNLSFSKEQLEWLRKEFDLPDYLFNYFKKFRFTGDLYAMPEGTIFFPNEPIIRITAPIIEAMIIEWSLVNIVYLQTILASKISRFINAANGKETHFGWNRVYGSDAALKSVRILTMLGGASSLLDYHFKHGSSAWGAGTFHFLIMAFENELDAFRAYIRNMKGKGYVLVDTYNSIQGIKNYIKAVLELKKEGITATGIQLDSGDLNHLSFAARKMFDRAGLKNLKIFAMSNLDEYKIAELEKQKAPIDVYAGTTNILTPSDAPTIELVYKLAELQQGARCIPKMKTSTKKVSLPGKKQVFRIIKRTKYSGDIIGLENEHLGEKLLKPIMKKGKLMYNFPTLKAINKYYKSECQSFPEKLFGFKRKYTYPVRISRKLLELQQKTRRAIIRKHQ